MIIRPIELNDAEKFLQLNKSIDESGFMLFEPGEKSMTLEQQRKAIENIIAEKNSLFLVAEVEHKLVGFMNAFGGKVKRNQHSAYLVLGVLDDFQGRGIASSLFNSVFAWAKDKEISRLELTVIKDNIKAFNLYKKMGFVIEGEKVNSLIINGQPMNEYYLYKLL
ncbi:GNAT family N-acetyltransferase [Cytobacillus sp. IB215665]|uniref:GNAT family N-acetyltransferase n=1 Tax=Cytobacillus sp. IB215665 TaxID=3097357 RepID=UPI002A0D6081|nr:GNAT family N-acetyltransferase [Cytobacillus sp. IB215665]MDX8366770.1 GNAT family N-acetyltransferase [Cytobacillus sp. IB215665]